MKKRGRGLAAFLTAAMVISALYGCGNGAVEADKQEQAADENMSVSENVSAKDQVQNADGAQDTSDNGQDVDAQSDKKGDSESSASGAGLADDNQGEDVEYSDVFVEKIENISDSFVMGMDASSVFVEENSGVKYYDFDGNEQDVFKTMAEAGVNCIRLRVWNDPYDAEGRGYGGGNNDVPTAIALGKRATEAGMSVMIDFHYSDFWADPNKQFAPKAWEGMGIDEKCEALSSFTADSLKELLDAGVNVAYVQIGNEINNGMAGEKDLGNVTKLLDAGSKAVRSVSKDIQIIVHYTNIENSGGKVPALVSNLVAENIDFDIVGLSYYPYWHGDLENLKFVVKKIRDRYEKKVMFVETSYPFTDRDGDGSGNSVDGKSGFVEGYPVSVQGQAHMVRDIIDAANEAGAIGLCYWEGVWIPVGADKSTNSSLWEKYGSGWASSFAGSYDPDDAGRYYGGCSWENQAMFDFKGNPLPSLNVFKYVYEGHKADLKVEAVPDLELTVDIGEEIVLPQKVAAIYNDPSIRDEIEIEWNPDDVAGLDKAAGGKFDVHGTLKNEEKSAVTCHVTIKETNYVLNPSFEDNNRSMWKVAYNGPTNPTDYQKKKDDAHDGNIALHFWHGSVDMDFTVSQEITGLEPGTYSLECFAQGGDTDDTAKMELFCDVTKGGDMVEHLSEPFAVTGWAQWKNPVISDIKVDGSGSVIIGVHIISNKKSWGTVDDFLLKKVD